MDKLPMLIGGEWIEAASDEWLQVFDPAKRELIGMVPKGGQSDALRAVDAASDAFLIWKNKTFAERSAIMMRLADRMTENREDLASTITREQGKPLKESLGEVDLGAEYLRWPAEESKRVNGTIPPSSDSRRFLVVREPVGVVAAITPWNFPCSMVTRKIGMPLAVGCTVVLKPAEQTPMTALKLAAMGIDAGLPPGVLNVVTGVPDEIGRTLSGDKRVRVMSFTGSTEVGSVLVRNSAANLQRLCLELGGNAPFLVFADANIERAVSDAIAIKFRNNGQTCVSANRFLVQSEVYDQFVHAFCQKADKLRVGYGFDNVDLGPLIDSNALAKVQDHIQDAVSKGASILTGGKILQPESFDGMFFEPTVLAEWSPHMLLAAEETFGPVAALKRFSSDEEAIELANATDYGLASYVYTRDGSRIMRVAERLAFGIVGVNNVRTAAAQAPMGGRKMSGYGTEGGREIVEEYTDIKYVSWDIDE